MGKAHVYGFATAEKVFDLPVRFDMDLIADANLPLAEAARQDFGFKRATANWRDLIDDPEIGLVDITAPNALQSIAAKMAARPRRQLRLFADRVASAGQST